MKTLECQLAQAQLGRYVAGHRLSEEVLEQLELHISNCADCKAAVQARRDNLNKPAPPTTAVVKVAVDEQEDDPPSSSPSYFKPVILSALLAGVLLSMGAVTKDPTRLFGNRADPRKVEAPVTKITQKYPEKWDRMSTPPPASQSSATVSPSPQLPKPTGDRAAVARLVRPKARQTQPQIFRSAKRPPAIRVYDANGQPVR